MTSVSSFVTSQNTSGRGVNGVALDYDASSGITSAAENAVIGFQSANFTSGNNVVVLDGPRSQYGLSVTGSGVVSITDNSTHQTVTDSGISNILFSGGASTTTGGVTSYSSIYFIDNAPNSQITALYQDVLGRQPDLTGLEYWQNQLSSGQNMAGIAGAFINSSEFLSRFASASAPADNGGVNDIAFTNALYQNVLGRPADTNGLNYWIGQLASGSIDRAGLVLSFTGSAENMANIGAGNGGWLINTSAGGYNGTTVTDLGTGAGSGAEVINGAGEVAGVLPGGSAAHSFIWQSGTGVIDIGLPSGGYVGSLATAINIHGEVVVEARTAASPLFSDTVQAFVWQSSTGYVALGVLSGATSTSKYGVTAVANGINDSGQVVGGSSAPGNKFHAFLWQSGTGMTDLGALEPVNSYSQAEAINNVGQVVGASFDVNGTYTNGFQNMSMRAFFWQRNVGMIDIGTLAGDTCSYAIAINNLGQAAGYSYLPTNAVATHAFVWQSGTGITGLGTLGGTTSSAASINDLSQVVGSSTTADGTRHAFMWQAGKGMTDLNSLLQANSGWVLSSAGSINDAGQIVGSGTHNGLQAAFELIIPSSSSSTSIVGVATSTGHVDVLG